MIKTNAATFEDEDDVKLEYHAKEDVIKINTAGGDDVVQKLAILEKESQESNQVSKSSLTLIDCCGMRSPSLESAKWIQLSRTLAPGLRSSFDDSSYRFPAPHPEWARLGQQQWLLLNQDCLSER